MLFVRVFWFIYWIFYYVGGVVCLFWVCESKIVVGYIVNVSYYLFFVLFGILMFLWCGIYICYFIVGVGG